MKKPRALLINPPIYDFSLFDLFHKPLGLMSIGKMLEESGYLVDVIDALDYRDEASSRVLGTPKRKANGTGKFFRQRVDFPHDILDVQRSFARYGILQASFESRLANTTPDIVLITSGMTYWYPGIVEAARAVRNAFPGTPIVVGGVYATLLPKHCLSEVSPDFIVAGKAEDKLPDILSACGLPDLISTRSDGVLLRSDVWRGAGVVRLNDGCPMNCDYCASRALNGGFVAGDPHAVVKEIQALISESGITSCAFYDDALLHRKNESFVPFLEELIESSINIPLYLPNAIHLRYLDYPTAKLMKIAGFQEIRLGYESSSPDFHSRHDNKVSPGDFADGIGMLKAAGFSGKRIITYVLAGMPGQHAGEVEASIRHVSSFGVRASVAEFSPVPGTALWEAAVANSRYPIAEEPLYQNNSLQPMAWDGLTRSDLQVLKDLSRALAPADG